MGNKKLITGAIILVAFVGLILLVRSVGNRGDGSATQAKSGSKAAIDKKVISKGKGALTVRIVNSKNMEIPMRIKAFRAIDGQSSVYATSSVGGRMQEVVPGTYDIEVDTVPQKIFKNIKVSEGKETVKDMGCIVGSITVKTLNVKKAAAYYPMRVLYANTNDMVTAYMTNKTMEIVPGVYDIEVGTSPRIYKKGIKVNAGKNTTINMGCMVGSLTVKVKDEAGRDVRLTVRIMSPDTNAIISSAKSNRPIDLGKGVYNIEINSNPKQYKKNISIKAGEEKVEEFTVGISPIVKKPAAKAKR
jgi:hypothetical protein